MPKLKAPPVEETNKLKVDNKDINNKEYILKDIIQGDTSALKYLGDDVDLEKVKIALNFLLQNEALSSIEKSELLQDSWRVLYRAKPPTPEEFLTEKYLGPLATTIYPRIGNTFKEFMNPNKEYRNLILYPHIGWGKSFLSTLITLYISTNLSLMRSIYKFFGLSPATQFSQMLISYSLKKSSELLVAPYLNILEASPFYEKVSRRDAMAEKVAEFEHKDTVDKLYYTTASKDKSSVFEFDSGLTIKVASSPQALLGLTLVSAVYSELAFFTDAGKSSEYIMRIYQDGVARVWSRLKDNYWGRVILDSSPNSLENAIDDFIINEAPKNTKNFIVSGSVWKWDYETYKPEFDEGKVFKVFTGGKGTPPRILEKDDALLQSENFNPTKVIDVPLSMKQLFIDDTVKALKDQAGIPSGSADALITDYSIIERMFDNEFKNIYTCLSAPSKDNPKQLLWRQVSSTFFKNRAGKFEYYYKPWIPRVISVDQSFSNDITGISMCHKERSPEKESDMYIVDFTIAIVPRENEKVNLESIRCFIEDLRDLGHMRIEGVSFDQFQSETTIQNLERDGFNVKKLSVDKTTGPYLNMVSLMNQNRIVCGKNIYLKNNIKSLHTVRSKKSGNVKIDHDSSREQVVQGNSNWETSQLGFFGKDVSDAVCASIDLCSQVIPIAQDNYEGYTDKAPNEGLHTARKDTAEFLSRMGLRV